MRLTAGCDRKRVFLTRRQSQSELQIHHFSEAGRRRGSHLRIFKEGKSVKGREEEETVRGKRDLSVADSSAFNLDCQILFHLTPSQPA